MLNNYFDQWQARTIMYSLVFFKHFSNVFQSGIPQSSLSRLFSSTTMPRRTTLFKIAKALNLPETAIGFKWTI
jgi:DNA-binding phage protein